MLDRRRKKKQKEQYFAAFALALNRNVVDL